MRNSAEHLPGPRGSEKKKGEEAHPIWPVTRDERGNICGLPEGKSKEDVIVFQGSDGGWYAQNPSSETLEDIRAWRPDWQDVKTDKLP